MKRELIGLKSRNEVNCHAIILAKLKKLLVSVVRYRGIFYGLVELVMDLWM